MSPFQAATVAVEMACGLAGVLSIVAMSWRLHRLKRRDPKNWLARVGPATQRLWLSAAINFAFVAAANVLQGGWDLLLGIVDLAVVFLALLAWTRNRGWWLAEILDSGVRVHLRIRRRPALVRELDRWYGRGALTHYCALPGVWPGMLLPPRLLTRLARGLMSPAFHCMLCGQDVPLYLITPNTLVPNPLAAPNGFYGTCQPCAVARAAPQPNGQSTDEPTDQATP